MSSQDQIDRIRNKLRRVVEKYGSKDVADGHCTFGVEYPSFARDEYGEIYFASLDLHGKFFFTGMSMSEVLNKMEKHIDDKHRLH